MSNVVILGDHKPTRDCNQDMVIVEIIDGQRVEFVNLDIPIPQRRPLNRDIERPSVILAMRPSP
jgi:hypothetical protein